MRLRRSALFLIALLCLSNLAIAAESSMHLIPAPKQLKTAPGALTLETGLRIITTDPALRPLAVVLSEEIAAVAGIAADAGTGAARPGDVVLELNDLLEGEAYTIEINDRVTVGAADARAMAFATVTLLQAIQRDQDGARLPRLSISDQPDAAHRGLMVDLARQWHPIHTLKQIIRICRFYKVRYLQLHLSDDQSFTFPSAAYPRLATAGRSYTREQLDDLVAYAHARGVILVPEIDVPAHATAMVRAMPDLFGSPAGGIINFRDPAVVEAVRTLIDEAIDTFPDSPYIHVGADEANLSPLTRDPGYIQAIEALGVDNIHGLFNHFLNQLNERIVARGKRMIAWEGFEVIDRGPGRLDPAVIVMPFDNYKNVERTYMPAGHDIINTSWYPMYIIPGTLTTPKHIFDWDLQTFGNYRSADPRSYDNVVQYTVTNTDSILGGQMCSWEQAADAEVESIRRRLAAMAERLWNRKAPLSYEQFAQRLVAADARLQHLLAEQSPAAVRPAASNRIHADRVELFWKPADGYPSGYTVLRGTNSDIASATVIAESIVDTQYTDTQATDGTEYYYWVKAINRHGEGPAGDPARGARGTDTRLVEAYEGFHYPSTAAITDAGGGDGWDSAWRVDEAGAAVTLKNEGLRYRGLQTTPGHLNVRFSEEHEGLRLSRDTTERQGVVGSHLWVSFLIRGNKIGAGHAFIQPAASNLAVGKMWGNGLCIDNRPTPYPMKPGETYLVVARYACSDGGDIGHVWVNPPLDREPLITDPGVATHTGDLGNSRTLKINIQQHGLGDYDIDEIRLGSTWRQVLPRR